MWMLLAVSSSGYARRLRGPSDPLGQEQPDDKKDDANDHADMGIGKGGNQGGQEEPEDDEDHLRAIMVFA